MQIKLNNGWHFHKGDIAVEKPVDKGPAYMQSKTERRLCGPASYDYAIKMSNHTHWETVNLPHDYIVGQDICQSENNAFGYLPYDNAWYRKKFTLPENSEGKRVTLRFDGIAGQSVIYLNGCLLKHNYSSYNTFEIDISDYVLYDKENVIAVYVNTEEFEGWWYKGGGIYRSVYLTVTEPVAIDLWGVYAPTEKISDHEWHVQLETTVINTAYDDMAVTAEHQLLDANGVCVATATANGTAITRDKTPLRTTMTVTDPLLWDCEHPHLYTVRTTLKNDTGVLDENDTRIGFRTIEFSAEKGFLLNGKKTLIKGICSHQDYGLTGLAVPDNVARYKIERIKEMGANGYRTSHYMQAESYMDALDELGFLVMDENRWFESTDETLAQVEALVKRDRNRPSVIFWSTSNEEMLHADERGRRIHRAIAAHIRKFDNTRPIMAAVVNDPIKCTVYDDSDVIGINYCLSGYDEVHAKYPEKTIVASECCATGTTRDWHYPTDSANGRIRDRDGDAGGGYAARERTWKHLMERPYVIGCYQWDSIEHRGEATWPRICSVSGAMDLFLQKKGAFYQNQSHWCREPMIHLLPHWNFIGQEGEDISVIAYTNCDEAELFVNGKSLGRKAIEPYGHGEWVVPFEAGTLSVIGFKDGKEVCRDVRETTGRPVSLRLTLDNTYTANGSDLALFTCECLDSEGRVVPDAAPLVHFSVSAPSVVVGTGSDNTDHVNVTSPTRRMYMGKIAVAVRPSAEQPQFELRAFADGLTPAVYHA